MPRNPVAPGSEVPEANMEIIEGMPVKSVITSPATGAAVKGRSLAVRGHAWAGERVVREVHLSADFGASWVKARLGRPDNRYAWQTWDAVLAFPTAGYYEIWARATDEKGALQPFQVSWNPEGYLNNAMHRISVTVA
jgi:hypothetical protein